MPPRIGIPDKISSLKQIAADRGDIAKLRWNFASSPAKVPDFGRALLAPP